MLGTVGRAPAPDFSTLAALHHAVTEDVGHHITIPGEQRFGGTHFSARRQLAFCEAVAAVFFKLGFAAIFLRATRAESAFVHLATHPKRALAGKLRCAEGTGV